MSSIKKSIAAILICVFTMSVLAGCGYVNKSEIYNDISTNDTFTMIASGASMTVYKEDVTDVMYAVYHSPNRGGLVVMLDTDGTPLLYSEWKDRLSSNRD